MKYFITTIILLFPFISFLQTNEEISMVIEINKIRKNPKSYIPQVKKYIKEQEWWMENTSNAVSYSGNMDKNNQITSKNTLKGKDVFIRNIASAEDLISVLDTLKPMDTLIFDQKMYKITLSHGQYLKKTNKTGHYGPNGQTLKDRFKNFNSSKKFSENCGTGLINLMVDAGVDGYGHRYNILDRGWNYVSIYYIKDHPTWGNDYMIQNFRE